MEENKKFKVNSEDTLLESRDIHTYFETNSQEEAMGYFLYKDFVEENKAFENRTNNGKRYFIADENKELNIDFSSITRREKQRLINLYKENNAEHFKNEERFEQIKEETAIQMGDPFGEYRNEIKGNEMKNKKNDLDEVGIRVDLSGINYFGYDSRNGWLYHDAEDSRNLFSAPEDIAIGYYLKEVNANGKTEFKVHSSENHGRGTYFTEMNVEFVDAKADWNDWYYAPSRASLKMKSKSNEDLDKKMKEKIKGLTREEKEEYIDKYDFFVLQKTAERKLKYVGQEVFHPDENKNVTISDGASITNLDYAVLDRTSKDSLDIERNKHFSTKEINEKFIDFVTKRYCETDEQKEDFKQNNILYAENGVIEQIKTPSGKYKKIAELEGLDELDKIFGKKENAIEKEQLAIYSVDHFNVEEDMLDGSPSTSYFTSKENAQNFITNELLDEESPYRFFYGEDGRVEPDKINDLLKMKNIANYKGFDDFEKKVDEKLIDYICDKDYYGYKDVKIDKEDFKENNVKYDENGFIEQIKALDTDKWVDIRKFNNTNMLDKYFNESGEIAIYRGIYNGETSKTCLLEGELQEGVDYKKETDLIKIKQALYYNDQEQGFLFDYKPAYPEMTEKVDEKLIEYICDKYYSGYEGCEADQKEFKEHNILYDTNGSITQIKALDRKEEFEVTYWDGRTAMDYAWIDGALVDVVHDLKDINDLDKFFGKTENEIEKSEEKLSLYVVSDNDFGIGELAFNKDQAYNIAEEMSSDDVHISEEMTDLIKIKGAISWNVKANYGEYPNESIKAFEQKVDEKLVEHICDKFYSGYDGCEKDKEAFKENGVQYNHDGVITKIQAADNQNWIDINHYLIKDINHLDEAFENKGEIVVNHGRNDIEKVKVDGEPDIRELSEQFNEKWDEMWEDLQEKADRDGGAYAILGIGEHQTALALIINKKDHIPGTAYIGRSTSAVLKTFAVGSNEEDYPTYKDIQEMDWREINNIKLISGKFLYAEDVTKENVKEGALELGSNKYDYDIVNLLGFDDEKVGRIRKANESVIQGKDLSEEKYTEDSLDRRVPSKNRTKSKSKKNTGRDI